MSIGLHHHLRKRKASEIQDKPFDARKILLDQTAYLVGMATALFNLPQLWRIWASGGNTEGVSLVSWLGFTAASCFWLYYARLHQEPALIATYALTLIMQLGIILGLLLL